MIVIDINNTAPFTAKDGIVTKQQGQVFSALEGVEALDFCYCKVECEYVELALFSEGGDSYKNDKSSFLFTKQLSADTISFELFKSGVKIDDITDNTYGTLYDGFDEQPLYKGYLVDWKKVYDEHGVGVYQFKAILNIIGQETIFESQKFQVVPYSVELANGTVKIETYQTGNIISSPFDFTDLIQGGWYQSTRLKAVFGNKQPTYEEDNYVDELYRIKQIQGKIIEQFSLSTKYLPSLIANDLFYSRILANRIYISDYNILNHEVYKSIDLVPVEPDTVEYQNTKTGVRHEWKFKKRVENNIKTNY